MADEDIAARKLIEVGMQVGFEVRTTDVVASPDRESCSVRAELGLGAADAAPGDEDEPESVVEWGAFGFIFVLAVLSFADARPRGRSVAEFRAKDDFRLSDFFGCLWFEGDRLHFFADYVRGRSMKTDIVIRGDGTATLQTWGRGQEALRWLDRLQGKALLRVI